MSAVPNPVISYGRRGGKGSQFFEARREQHQDAAASRQRLGNGLGETEMLRAGQDKPSRFRTGVDIALQVGEQLRDMLDFIQDGPTGIPTQKSTRIAQCKIPDIQRLQRDIGFARVCHPAQRVVLPDCLGPVNATAG